MNNTLKLHFADKKSIGPCIQAIREVTNIFFKVEDANVDLDDVATKPELACVTAAVLLVFESPEDCKNFMKNPLTQAAFLEHSPAAEKYKPKPVTDEEIDSAAQRSEN